MHERKFAMNLWDVQWQCVYKIHHLTFKASLADMQTPNVHGNNNRMLTRLRSWHFTGIFSPHLRCAPEKGPEQHRTSTQNCFMVSREKAEQKGLHNTTKKRISMLLFFSSSVSLSLAPLIICSTKARHSFWMISAAKEMGRGGKRVRKGAKAAVASISGQT